MQARLGDKVLMALADLGKIALSALFTAIIAAVLTIPVVVVVLITDPSRIQGTSLSVDMFSGFGMAVMVCTYIGFTAGTLITYALFERKRGWTFGWKQQLRGPYLAIGMGGGIVLMTAAWALIWAAGGLSVRTFGFEKEWTWLLGLFLFACVAFGEEWFSRGYLQGLIRHDFGPAAAIGVSSFLFALMHGLNEGVWETPIPIVNLFLAGILLGLSRERSGGLWMPMGLHLTWNYMQGVIYGFPVSGTNVDSLIHMQARGSGYVSGGSFGAEGSLLTTAVLLAAVVLLARTKNFGSALRREEGPSLSRQQS